MNILKKNICKWSLALIAGFTLFFTGSSICIAQSSETTGAQSLEIGPPVIILNGDPGQSVQAKISVRDISKGDLLVTNQINDFESNGEDGVPRIILDTEKTTPYSMKDWITPIEEVVLKSQQVKEFAVSINIPSNAAPGGYYGAIRFTGVPPELEGTGMSLSASLGALVLLRVNGEVKESVDIEEFSVNYKGRTGTLFETDPLTLVVRLKNNGNIHEQPSGNITVDDMFGKRIATMGVNSTAYNVLPQSTRKFEQVLESSNIGNKMLFGKYTATVNITYGDKKETITKKIEFWVIPYTLIACIIFALIAGFFLVRFLIRRYNDHILAKGSRRHGRR